MTLKELGAPFYIEEEPIPHPEGWMSADPGAAALQRKVIMGFAQDTHAKMVARGAGRGLEAAYEAALRLLDRGLMRMVAYREYPWSYILIYVYDPYERRFCFSWSTRISMVESA